MSGLTTRELLYLEDVTKLFEAIVKNCEFASSSAIDPEFKSYLDAVAYEHKQWISATASLVERRNMH